MNYVEAIRSGMPYRREGFVHWRPSFDPKENWLTSATEQYRDIVAADWEIQEKEITVTRSQILAAHTKVLNGAGVTCYASFSELLLKELGL